MIYLRPLDLSVDETMQEILDAIKRIGAKRLVIDSLAGFEMALAPGFRTDFRESLYRMIFALTGIGVTILSTLEMEESFTELPFSTFSISFLTDDIIRLRYVEIEGQLRKILMVIKMRGGNSQQRHPRIRDHGQGIVIGERLTGYDRADHGNPRRVERPTPKKKPSRNRPPGDKADGCNKQLRNAGARHAGPLPAVAEASPMPMAAVEGAGHIVRYVNPAFCRLAGKPDEELIGNPFSGSCAGRG